MTAPCLVARGDARIDNGKFKTALGKGKMLSTDVVRRSQATPWAVSALLDWRSHCLCTWMCP
jgi:hypothetical protein